MRVAIGTPGGPVRQYLDSNDEVAIGEQLRDGESAIVTDARGPRWIDAGSLELGDPPFDIGAARDALWLEAKAVRSEREFGGAETPIGRVDTDTASQLRIAGAVQMATIATQQDQPFSIDWTLADNTTITLDAAGMIAVGVAVAQHVSGCHEAARGVRGEIDAASDAEALAATDLSAGYPA